MFSPYYAAARRAAARRAARGAAHADPLDHAAFNIVLSGGVRRWCMTERPRRDVSRGADALQIGASALHWDGQRYRFELRERGCPWPRAVRGAVQVEPELQPSVAYALDREARHYWIPLAPRARVSVELHQPALRWSGSAYLDSNRGERALEQDFRGWQWSRSAHSRGTQVYYEPRHRRDPDWPLALEFSPAAQPRALALPTRASLPKSGWRIAAHARADSSDGATLVERLVDAPFYSRSLLRTQHAGESVATVHESLDLDRFSRRWVQWLLPFRMPRRRRR